ncbi:MAG: ferritin-like domain-containing protein [Verrucomicrobia bacterium]|nr:ferritin-like domain-containing protein [Verrucomicrobiota bacterium]
MELRELAQRVLFATTLKEKLWCPADVTDEQPGPALAAPAMPGRPAELLFKIGGSSEKSDFPGLRQLDEECERGRLLHYFANHELLATELMALVLLRFPEAPAAFRRGVLQTLRDEQEHTRLYLARMRASGIAFGDLPVSGYFWRAVSTMQSPMDYVAGLSLTFEQANLDFARHFAHGFSVVGDADTAALLDRIYRDEIGHVASGLKWFRRWKQPGQSDWDAFCAQLKFPLSPRRAKGVSLNVEGRRAAGLDPQFIAELDVFAQSKGRTPSIFVFNPFAEGRIAQGKSFTPVKHQAQLARDLAALPMFLCRQDDVVLVEERPVVEFLGELKHAGFSLPEFVALGRGVLTPAQDVTDAGRNVENKRALSTLAQRKLGRLRPWAWGPDSVELLAPLFASLTGEARTPESAFNRRTARLYSKAWSADFLRRFLDQAGAHAASAPTLNNKRKPHAAAGALRLCSRDEVGIAVDTLEAALAAIAAIRARGHHRVVVKQAFGLAGHNALRLWEPDLLSSQRRWLENSLRGGRQVVVEPWLERLADFSVQLELKPAGLCLLGYTGLLTDARGQFLANTASPNFARALPPAVADYLQGQRGAVTEVRSVFDALFRSLEVAFKATGYLGPIGVDAFLYRDSEGYIRLKPVVEINPRYTMGRLTLELMRRVVPGAGGLFRLANAAMLRASGFADFSSYAAHLRLRHPILLEGEPLPRLRSGAICLNDPAQAKATLAVFFVGDDASNF